MARYDWTAEKDPPVTVSERMIHEGIGVMNTRLLMLIDSMIDLLEITTYDQFRGYMGPITRIERGLSEIWRLMVHQHPKFEFW